MIVKRKSQLQEADIPPFIVHGQNSSTNSHRTVLRISLLMLRTKQTVHKC